MFRPVRILLTNDDGYFSDGINALFRELSRSHDVYLIAPDREQSASSHSLTLNRPLRVHRIDRCRWITDGTPTDCVMLGVHIVFKGKHPDMIISGINHGANMGDDITYSGTVAAAIEGAILKIPSLAVSMADYEPGMSMKAAARFIGRLVGVYASWEVEPSTFLNVNLPANTGRGYRKVAFTQQGVRQYKDVIVKKTDPRGKSYYWIGGRPKWKAIKGSDFAAVSRGFVSITPMKLDLTDNTTLQQLKTGKVKV